MQSNEASDIIFYNLVYITIHEIYTLHQYYIILHYFTIQDVIFAVLAFCSNYECTMNKLLLISMHYIFTFTFVYNVSRMY